VVTEAGGLTVNQVAGALYVDKSTASRIAAGLVDRELMVREAEENDARTVWLAATPSGQALYATIRADEERDFAMLLGGLDAERRAEVLAALSELGRRFATSVEAVGGSCRVVR
jgi:DNA-binding MarR family transcriptional regulator